MTSQRRAERCSYLYKPCLRKGDADKRGAVVVNVILCPSGLHKVLEIQSYYVSTRLCAYQQVL